MTAKAHPSHRSSHAPDAAIRSPWTQAARYRPFCSERCKMIDLGAWATERIACRRRQRARRPYARPRAAVERTKVRALSLPRRRESSRCRARHDSTRCRRSAPREPADREAPACRCHRAVRRIAPNRARFARDASAWHCTVPEHRRNRAPAALARCSSSGGMARRADPVESAGRWPACCRVAG